MVAADEVHQQVQTAPAVKCRGAKDTNAPPALSKCTGSGSIAVQNASEDRTLHPWMPLAPSRCTCLRALRPSLTFSS